MKPKIQSICHSSPKMLMKQTIVLFIVLFDFGRSDELVNSVMRQMNRELLEKCFILIYHDDFSTPVKTQFPALGLNLREWQGMEAGRRMELTRKCSSIVYLLSHNATEIADLAVPTKRDAHYAMLQKSSSFWECHRPLTPRAGTTLSKVLNLVSITTCGNSLQIWRKQICPDPSSSFVPWSRGQNLYEKRQKLGCRLFRITTFNVPPVTISSTNEDGSVVTKGGYEALMVDSVMQYLGITNVTKNIPTDNQAWGQEISPGVMTGLYGDLQNDRTDLSNAYIWIVPNLRRFADFSNPYAYSTICFMVQ